MSSLRKRIEARDATTWPEPNVSANRLGWLDSPRAMAAQAADLSSWAADIAPRRIILLGMGGSSLGPKVLGSCRHLLDGPPADRELVVLDTTDPTTIAAVDFSDAFIVVSSKSGTTLEVLTLLAHARSINPDPSCYAIVTDPGTPLAELGEREGFNRIFANQSDIGGRYSVLSYFGMVPAALLGYDVAEMCSTALDIDREEAVELGVDAAQAVKAGRDKATFLVPEPFASLGLWLEQLIAESTGKESTGCVPVPTTELEEGDDRHNVTVDISRASELGPIFFRWEMATAAAGHELAIDPFNEPNVTESKQNTNKVLDDLPPETVEALAPGELWGALDEQVKRGDYVSLQAYLPFGQDADMERVRRKIRDRFDGLAVTAGYGPRFLHSTGQLHKGGPNEVVPVQLTHVERTTELGIPGYPYDFSTLIEAQALGDYQSLKAHGRRVLRVAVESLADLG
ncbi:MAG: glucose-6-phosphate isomerase [Acidimicrobiales bacterium]